MAINSITKVSNRTGKITETIPRTYETSLQALLDDLKVAQATVDDLTEKIKQMRALGIIEGY